MSFEIVTFTGIDKETPLHRLFMMKKRFPYVEFGILIGSNTYDVVDGGIFPSMDWITQEFLPFAQEVNLDIALHLCGRHSRRVMDKDGPTEEDFALYDRFGRIQVNLHGDNFNPEWIDVRSDRLRAFADKVKSHHVILQHRLDWSTVPSRHPKVEYLFDESSGRGVELFDHWPEPSGDLDRMGYSGGIGPHSIDKALDFADRYKEHRLWIDMEGNVRTAGWFSVTKAEDVCSKIMEHEGRKNIQR